MDVIEQLFGNIVVSIKMAVSEVISNSKQSRQHIHGWNLFVKKKYCVVTNA